MKKWGVLKKRKGSALVWVLVVLIVLTILISSVAYIVRQNTFETSKQEERLQTYYIALAGIDLTYAALMDPANSPKKIEQVRTKLTRNSTPITDNITIDINGDKKGVANVAIDRIKVKEINWIRITSVGQLNGNNTKVSSIMRINEDNHNQIVRER